MKLRLSMPGVFDRRFALSVGALVMLAVAVGVAGVQLGRSWRAQEAARRTALIESLDFSARLFRDATLQSASLQRMRFVAPIVASLPPDAPLLGLERFASHAYRELAAFGLADDTLFGAFRVVLDGSASEFSGILARDSVLRARVLRPVRAYSDQLVRENLAIVAPAVRFIGLSNNDQLSVVFAHQRVVGKGVVAIYGVTHSRRKILRQNSLAALAMIPILPPGVGGADWREETREFALEGMTYDSAEVRGSTRPERLDRLDDTLSYTRLPSNKVLAVSFDDNFGDAFRTGNWSDSAWKNSPWVGTFRADADVNSNIITVALRHDIGDAYMAQAINRTERWLLGAVIVLALLAAAAAIVQIRRQQDLIRTRADFVSAVSHELRTPLAQIRMFSETLLLGRARSPEQGMRWLRIINRESERMTHLVESILLFSRSERNGTRLAREVTDLADIVRESIDAFVPIASAKSATVHNVLMPHAIAYADAGAIRQVLVNLLDNAVKYGPEGQTITVKLEPAPRNTLELSVTDQGRGVPKSQREQIWKPFVRLLQDEGTTGGSGLGLSVVRDLVERHGGRIIVADNPDGRGARFIVLLPRGLDSVQLAEAEIKMERQRIIASQREAFAATPVYGTPAAPRIADSAQ